jgi:hypothetical protein
MIKSVDPRRSLGETRRGCQESDRHLTLAGGIGTRKGADDAVEERSLVMDDRWEAKRTEDEDEEEWDDDDFDEEDEEDEDLDEEDDDDEDDGDDDEWNVNR